MKYLALDYGIKRTGVALSDTSGSFAFPKVTIQMQGKDHFFGEILALIQEEQVEAVVIGLPIRSDGSDSETTRMVRNMAARLKRRSPLPVYFMEETLSSHEAEQHLRESGKKGKALTAALDQAAAVLILSSFLSLPSDQRVTV